MGNGSKELLKVNCTMKNGPKLKRIASARARSKPVARARALALPRMLGNYNPRRLGQALALSLPHPLPPRPSVVAGATRGAGRAARLIVKFYRLGRGSDLGSWRPRGKRREEGPPNRVLEIRELQRK